MKGHGGFGGKRHKLFLQKLENFVKPENKNTYTMLFVCGNCKTVYEKELPLGVIAFRNGGICPYCKCGDGDTYTPSTFYKPEDK